MSTRCGIALALAAAVAALGACSLPTDPAPQAIAVEDVPFDLLGDATNAPEAEPGPDTTTATLYFVGADTVLVPVSRTLETTGDRAVIASLLAGRADSDPANVTSSLVEVQLLEDPFREADGTRLVLNLSEQLTVSVGEGQRQAAAQITFTALDLPDVDSVRLNIEGDPFNVGLPEDGRPDIVDASDFPDLDPDRAEPEEE